jgi:hypothetical protein
VGELIELAPYLRLRSPVAGTGRTCGAPPAREGDCESCASRAAVAEVFRSDAVVAGLGGRLQCARCLAAELRRKRCGPEAQRAEHLLSARLRAATRALRIELEWDVRQERALALDGVPLE